MSKSDIDQAAKALKSWKSGQSDLYHHLSELISNIPTDQVNGVIHFQRISEFFKKSDFNPPKSLTYEQLVARQAKKIQYPKTIEREQNIKQKLKEIQKPINNEKKQNIIIQNFQKDHAILFNPIGISFGKQDSYRIQAALKILALKYKTKNIRFFGKILGRNQDYFIIQGQQNKNRQPEKVSDDMEVYGEGANYYTFWVSNKITGDEYSWLQLPLVTPSQIKISRSMKYTFTGKLTAKLKGYPYFPGEERHFLKCQLVRIAHNCQIVPNNLYTKNQQNPDIVQFAEEFKMPEFADLTNLQNWVHYNPFILQSGRSKHYTNPALSAEEKEQLMNKLTETDPPIERLKQINQDKPIQKLGMQGCWIAKQSGNLQLFNNIGKDEGTTSCYGSVVLKNPHWPGWITTANNKMFSSIYIGYGIKLTQSCFYPMTNQDLLIEGEDNDQFDEPNPRDPPDELEPDSDDDNKKQDGQ